jgi:hypothetical protein
LKQPTRGNRHLPDGAEINGADLSAEFIAVVIVNDRFDALGPRVSVSVSPV